MATIRKRGSSWQAQVRRQGHAPVSHSFRRKPDAATWARRMEADLERSDLPVDRRRLRTTTLSSLLARYRDEITPTKRGALQERYRISQLLAHRIGALPLEKLTPAAIASYRDERLQHVKGVTLRRELALLRHVIEIARKEWDFPIANPVAPVKLPVLPVPRTRRLATSELDAILEDVERSGRSLLRSVVLFAIETGLRRSELINVEWSHVDVEHRTLLVPHSKNGHSRVIPLSSCALSILSEIEVGGVRRVFPISANAVRLAWERLKRRVGINDLHFHDLRHEAISRFFEKGLSVPEVALISGHRDVRMLFRYTHLKAEDVARKLG
jgi:integrase